MAITTIDGVLAGMQPPFEFFKASPSINGSAVGSTFLLSGVPGAAAVPTPGMAGEALTSYAGQIPFTNPGSGNTYLARLSAMLSLSTGASTLDGFFIVLCDRLWHNSGIDVTQTTAQTINSVAWPARDRNESTNGEQVLVALESSNDLGNGGYANTTTLQYTNQAGTSGRTGTMAIGPGGSSPSSFVTFELDAGDTGIRSIQSLTLGASYISGNMHLVAYRPLYYLGVPKTTGATGSEPYNAHAGNSIGPLHGFVRLYDDTVPFFLAPLSSAICGFRGLMTVCQG